MATMPSNDVTIRAARADDLSAVRALLDAAHLPLDGLDEQFGDGYAVAECDGTVIGAEGIETYEDSGLLRSAIVHDTWRGRGIGDALTRDRLDWARSRGLRAVYLLTTTAADYFPRYGFIRVERASAPAAVQRSREFAEACPQTAVTMRLVFTTELPT
jgi:amino-acid N-acetyltransferase